MASISEKPRLRFCFPRGCLVTGPASNLRSFRAQDRAQRRRTGFAGPCGVQQLLRAELQPPAAGCNLTPRRCARDLSWSREAGRSPSSGGRRRARGHGAEGSRVNPASEPACAPHPRASGLAARVSAAAPDSQRGSPAAGRSRQNRRAEVTVTVAGRGKPRHLHPLRPLVPSLTCGLSACPAGCFLIATLSGFPRPGGADEPATRCRDLRNVRRTHDSPKTWLLSPTAEPDPPEKDGLGILKF